MFHSGVVSVPWEAAGNWEPLPWTVVSPAWQYRELQVPSPLPEREPFAWLYAPLGLNVSKAISTSWRMSKSVREA